MPTLLAIETSTPTGSVALINDHVTIHEISTNSNETHAATLLPAIDELFSSTDIKLDSIDGIAVSIGPGAFTGLRVGISTAQGLAQTLKIPIYPIPTLEAFALSISKPNHPIFVTLDARKEEIYGALFETRDNITKRLIAESVHSPEEWCKVLKEHLSDNQCYIAGPGYLKYKKIFQESLQKRIIGHNHDQMLPRSIYVGLAALKNKPYVRETGQESIKPLYIRNPY